MDVVFKDSGGSNVILRPQAEPADFPEATAPAAEVEVSWVYEGEPYSAAAASDRVVGRFSPGQEVTFRHYPDVDRNVILLARSFSADGTPSVMNWEDAEQVGVLFRREADAPTVSQVGDATADAITLAVDGVTRFARIRRIRVADSALMAGAVETVRDFGGEPMPRLVAVDRTAALVADFSWAGDDPAGGARFTKNGTGAAAASTSPAGWRITTTGTDAATYYTKNSWPANAFLNGFTLDLVPPAVVASDGAALPNDSVLVRVDNGAKRYDLRFSSTNVYLNGGAAHAHGGSPVRLVVAAGGLTADLWVGDSKVVTANAGPASLGAGLLFGDRAGVAVDDSEVVWKTLAYALTAQDVTLAETIYVRVSHSSGGAFGAESDVLEVTFASEGGAGGSTGAGDEVPRDRYTYGSI